MRRTALNQVLAALALIACAATVSLRYTSHAAAESLPSRLSDKAFWQLVSDFSEPNGYFRSDNFLSNERGYQRVIPELQTTVGRGGAYIGVGPEQNFAYLVALRPKIAFIVDIRRGNLHEHLLYKAFIEMSSDRADFLSRLFARPRPDRLAADATIDALLAAYQGAMPSPALFDRNLQAARDRLVKQHGFALTSEDLDGLAYVYRAFYDGGPDLNYSFGNNQFGAGRFGGGFFPTYTDLMTETDGLGHQLGYLASEENFKVLADIEKNNALVPIVGDFGGPKAIRAVGKYLNDHGAIVGAFYTSNVEMYLFQSSAWKRFYANVATLPTDAKSRFIRSVSNRGAQVQGAAAGLRNATRLSPIAGLLEAFQTGKIQGYYDVIAMSH